MFLVTTIRIPNGYRLLVAVPSNAPLCQWSLSRNGNPLALPVATAWLDNVIAFELRTPLAPGPYALWLSVDNHDLLAASPLLSVIRAGLLIHPMATAVTWVPVGDIFSLPIHFT